MRRILDLATMAVFVLAFGFLGTLLALTLDGPDPVPVVSEERQAQRDAVQFNKLVALWAIVNECKEQP